KSTHVWQRALLTLCAIGLVAVAECAWGTYYLEGDFYGGSVYNPVTTAPFVDQFESVTSGSVAQKSGIRAGDAIDLLRISPDARYHERTGEPLMGDPLRLAIKRDGSERYMTITPEPYVQTLFWKQTQWWLAWAFWIGSAFSLCIAALLIWRRPENTEVRLLSLTLILIVLGESLFPINGFITPWGAFDAVVNVVAQILFSAGVALLAGYALLFGHPVSPARRVLTWFTYGIAALSALIWTGAAQGGPGPGGLVGIAGLWFGTLDIHAWLATRPLPTFATVVAPSALALLCAALAVRAATGAERPRVAWAAGSLAILYIFGIATIQSYFTSNIVTYYAILNICWVLAPLGLTYALLSRRLLDIGFALNRAAVFTGVSLLVVGIFSLIEWALGGWLNTASRVANVAVSAAIVVALGLSLRQIHARVDRFVDSVFFRKRHEDEFALKRFTREVAFITEPDVVVRRAVETLRQHADASSVELLLNDGAGHFGHVDENDRALVTLRASHEVVDLNLVDTAIKGEFAYPMIARGQPMGALVIGAKCSGEPYAPDESQAIAQLAHAVGVALDVLGVRPRGAGEEILGALRSLEAASRAANDALRALPDTIAERLLKERL
ncbi:MAG TPA: hypothetical protein VEV38_02105, partial [Candidatus Eremiobacteraceae bacterium]|nr:hypothetical protein [Candidatus Eremiobacteraceae bacterium]